MSDLKELKKRIIEEDKIGVLLEDLGCTHVKSEQNGALFTSQLPEKFESDNKRAVQVRNNDSMTCNIRNRPDFRGDIFSLISYLAHDKRGEEIDLDLMNAKNYITKLFGWIDNGVYKPKTDYLQIIRQISKSGLGADYEPNEIYDESILDNFILMPYQDWVDEGVPYKIQAKYQVGFDIMTERVIFPIRNRLGGLVGVKGRYIGSRNIDDKYRYLYPVQMNQEWFNLNNAEKYIIEQNEVIVVESEKSVMKLEGIGIHNSLAISSSNLSETKINILYRLGEDVNIVIGYDKDMFVERDKQMAMKRELNRLKNNNVQILHDRNNLLDKKDAPIDKGKDVWHNLYDNRIVFKGELNG